MAKFTQDDIRAVVSQNAFRAGDIYRRQGRVLSLSVSDDGLHVASRVQGNERRPYRQTITIEPGRAAFNRIEGECSCPVGYNCKHVAAALLAVLAGEGARGGAPAIARPALPTGAAADDHRPKTDEPVAAVTPEVSAWLDRLSKAEMADREDYPETVRQRLIYVLTPGQGDGGVPLLFVTPTSAYLRKDGSFTDDGVAYNPATVVTQANLPKFLRPADRTVMRRLHDMARIAVGPPGSIPLSGEHAVEVLRAIIGTGRARLDHLTGPDVREGDPRPGEVAWHILDDGRQRPVIALAGDAVPLRLAPPWWLDRKSGIMGPIETGLPPGVAAALLTAPPIRPEEADRVRVDLARRLPGLALPGPRPVERAEPLRERPVPVLRLALATLPVSATMVMVRGWNYAVPSQERKPKPVARLSFRYGTAEIAAATREERIRRMSNGRLVEIVRDMKRERHCVAHLEDLGFARATPISDARTPNEHESAFIPLGPEPNEPDWTDFLYHDAPDLSADGWIVEIAEDFPVRLAVPSGEIAARIDEGSGIDWFELDLGVMVDGERIDLVGPLIAAIESPSFDQAAFGADTEDDEPLYLPLPDGRILAIPSRTIQPIVAVLRDLFNAGAIDAKSNRIGFSSFAAADLAALEEAGADGLAITGGERLRALGRMLRDVGRIPETTLPASFAATLRPYQARGVDWLQALSRAGLGGILADDMGLGKTVEALAHLSIEKAEGRLDRPALVIAPTSVVPNWRREAERFAPDLSVLTLHGPDRKASFDAIAAHDLVLTTYPLLARDHAELTAIDWSIVLLDEAHTIKNPDAVTTRLARQLRARQRIGLTGTPIENHLGELWSLFAFLAPGFLGDRDRFRRSYRIPIEKKGDTARRQALAQRVKPFVLRRTKTEVAADLPPKTEIVEAVEMGKAQRAVYESIRLAMHDRVRAAIAARGLKRSGIVILDALLKMRQACCDPRLLRLQAKEAAKAGSAKLDRLIEILPTLVEDGRRILLFSQFTSMLALIEAELQAVKLPYLLLTGDTRDRDPLVRRFQGGEVPLFLISLKAGGVGLNLTAADTVIHYDPWWNPAVEDQATDRAHRIGQDKPVFVHKLMAVDSIEEKMEVLKARKRDLANLFDEGAGDALNLTEADIEALFAPA